VSKFSFHRRSRLLVRVCTTVAILWGVALAARTARAQMPQMSASDMMGWKPVLFVLFDKFEYSPNGGERPAVFDVISWYGGSHNRLWFLAEGDQNTKGKSSGRAEAQVMYGRLIDPFWDAVAGVRVERNWTGAGDTRAFLSLGLMGLAPYRFEFAPTVFVSSKGELSARIETSYQILITQRFMAEPVVELNGGLQKVPKAGLRQGLNDYDLQLRLRYEFRREFAPYIGWSRVRQFGNGESGSSANTGARTRFLLGVRLWH
jgi:copper resistance protein B